MFKITADASYDEPFLSVCHDMWTNANDDNGIGSALRFITPSFHLVTYATAFLKNNVSHGGAEHNSKELKALYLDCYGIDLDRHAKFVTSDTCNSARAVSQYIMEVEQVDCDMHIANLVLLYALGLRENTSTRTEVVDGRKKKITEICTPGGEFVAGEAVIKKFAGFAITSSHHRERRPCLMCKDCMLFLRAVQSLMEEPELLVATICWHHLCFTIQL